jgi:hypothetical protein
MKSVIAIAFGVIIGLSASAQKRESGIYLTQFDFENQKLTYSTASLTESNRIQFNELLGKPFINIKNDGKKIILFKDDVFAYKNKNQIVRTHHFVSYNFAENGVIWIYFKDLNISLGKGIKKERKYFYSVGGKGEIIPLTVSNLKKSFPSSLLHNFLDAQFRSDSDLASYNHTERKFQVNHFLETTFSSSNTSGDRYSVKF